MVFYSFPVETGSICASYVYYTYHSSLIPQISTWLVGINEKCPIFTTGLTEKTMILTIMGVKIISTWDNQQIMDQNAFIKVTVKYFLHTVHVFPFQLS